MKRPLSHQRLLCVQNPLHSSSPLSEPDCNTGSPDGPRLVGWGGSTGSPDGPPLAGWGGSTGSPDGPPLAGWGGNLTDMTALTGWANFYVIVGSSAGALIGLQFVVITLIANRPIAPGQGQGAAAFATPTIVHFGSVLLVSAVGCAPWHSIAGAAVLWGLLGLVGIVYEAVVIRRMRRQSLYQPVFEDWLFHALLPLASYATLAASAEDSRLHAQKALFGIALAALLLLFIGIHNAWDAVTYHVFSGRSVENKK